MTRFLFVAMISAVALAQEAKTEAEALFEKAWWEETASGALDKALEGYRKAADATGPAAIRARSLYRAAIVEQRLGRTDAAVALLERLARDFPGETDLLKEAKTRLQEWTAVDLRKSFGEWYRTYVFSPEFQARVVDLVLRMGTGDAKASIEAYEQLLTIGEASVPALQEALKSSNEYLRACATELLLCLGVVPPTASLVGDERWTDKQACWLALYGADEATRRRVREEAKGDAPLVRAVRAAATSPEELLSFVLAEPGYLSGHLLPLLADHSGDAMRERVESLLREPSVPAEVTTFLRHRHPSGPDDADVARCIDWARSLPSRPAREVAAYWAALKLTEKSEADLDAVLALVPDPDAIVSEVGPYVIVALSAHGNVAGLAWTPARVGVLLDLSLRIDAARERTGEVPDAAGSIDQLLKRIRQGERGATALADALLDRVARLRQAEAFNWSRPSTASHVFNEGGIWRALFVERLVARWPRASAEERTMLLGLLAEGNMILPRDFRERLAKDGIARNTAPELQVAIVSLLGRVDADDLLAAYDLSRTEDAEAAVGMLERLSGRIERTEQTLTSMCEILIHARSPARLRALQVLDRWQWQKYLTLLPAAKELCADEASEVRMWAIDRLCNWSSFDAAPYLVKALSDPDANIRWMAATGLASIGREDAIPALVKLLDDPNATVRTAAIAAMEQIRKVAELKQAWLREQAGLGK